MCPHTNGDALPNDPSQMVMVDANAPSVSRTSGVSANGATAQHPREQRRNPYAPRASDFLSNVSNFSIIESTLRGWLVYVSSHLRWTHWNELRGRTVC